MKQTDRMKEWRQTIAVICTVVLTVAALGAYIQIEHAAMRADMNAQRADMNAQITGLRADMNAGFAAIREQLNSLDRRTSRIEGHLFGIEIPPDRADGE